MQSVFDRWLKLRGIHRVALLLFCVITAGAQTNKTQSITLPDPTPRDPDPHLLFGESPANPAHQQQLMAKRNEQRRQLMQWAANEMVSLSERLEVDLAKHQAGGPMIPAETDAERIEKIAKSLKEAVKAQ